MNRYQLSHYLLTTQRKAGLISWHIDTVLGDLQVFKMTSDRQEYWLERVRQEKADLIMFNEEIRIIKEQLESAK